MRVRIPLAAGRRLAQRRGRRRDRVLRAARLILAYARGVEQFPVTAIGWVSSSRREPIDDDWGEIESTIQLDAAFEAESLRGLTEFSHVEVVYLFHLVDLSSITTDARRPRGNPRGPRSASSPSAARAARTASASRPAA